MFFRQAPSDKLAAIRASSAMLGCQYSELPNPFSESGSDYKPNRPMYSIEVIKALTISLVM